MLENHLEFPKIIKTCPQKDLCMNIHSNIIHNSPKLETTQVSSPSETNCDNSHTTES